MKKILLSAVALCLSMAAFGAGLLPTPYMVQQLNTNRNLTDIQHALGIGTSPGSGPSDAITNNEVRAVTLNSNLTVAGTLSGNSISVTNRMGFTNDIVSMYGDSTGFGFYNSSGGPSGVTVGQNNVRVDGQLVAPNGILTDAAGLTNVPASGIIGPLTNSINSTNAVLRNATVSGNGSGLTGLSATAITGTLTNSINSTNAVLVNATASGNGGGWTNVAAQAFGNKPIVLFILGDSWSSPAYNQSIGVECWPQILSTNQLTNLIAWSTNGATAGYPLPGISNVFDRYVTPGLAAVNATNVGVLVVLGGVNDSRKYDSAGLGYAADGATGFNFASNIWYRARAAGLKVIAATIPMSSDMGQNLAGIAQWRMDFNSLVIANAQLYDAVLDVGGMFPNPWNANLIRATDTLHATTGGQRLVAAEVSRLIESVVTGKPTGRSLSFDTETFAPNPLKARTLVLATPDGNTVGSNNAAAILIITSNYTGSAMIDMDRFDPYPGGSNRFRITTSMLGVEGVDDNSFKFQIYQYKTPAWLTPLMLSSGGNAYFLSNIVSTAGNFQGNGSGLTNLQSRQLPLETNAFIVPPASVGTSGGTAWPYAALIGNRFQLAESNVVRYVNFRVATTAAGNIGVAIYSLSGNLGTATQVVSSGLFTTPANSDVHYDVGKTLLGPGQYLVCLWATNTALVIPAGVNVGQAAGKLGVEQNAGTGIPSSFTPAWSNRYVVGLTVEGDY